MSFEVEIKIKLDDDEKKAVEVYLENKKYLGKSRQVDAYFDTNPPSYARLDKALRLRMQTAIDSDKNGNDDVIELTFKGPKLNLDSKTRKELNLDLNNKTKFETIEIFLFELGFSNAIKIVKTRKSWTASDIHFSLDKNDLGYYLEIEKIIEAENLIEDAEEDLWILLQKILDKKLSKNRKITKSYLQLLLEAGKVTYN